MKTQDELAFEAFAKSAWGPSGNLKEYFLAGIAHERQRTQALVEAAQAILPEVHALYTQAGHGRLSKMDDNDIVYRKSSALSKALESFKQKTDVAGE